MFLLLLGSKISFSFSIEERDTTQIECNIYFRLSSSEIEQSYRDNSINLSNLNRVLNECVVSLNRDSLNNASDNTRLISISILGSSSIEGDFSYNLDLAQKRATTIKSYILSNYPTIREELLNISYSVTGWNSVVAAVNDSTNIPAQKEAQKILNSNISIPQKIDKLKVLSNGAFWNYLSENALWRDRVAVSIINILDEGSKQCAKNCVAEELKPESSLKEFGVALTTSSSLSPTPTPTPNLATSANTEAITTFATVAAVNINEIPLLEKQVEPLFALKTNLLFDAATLINVELEVPIKNRWSIAGEWIFPWWKNCNGKEDSKRNRTQFLNGNIDLKYWFGNREKYRVLTGWFASVYVGGGIYDFERDGIGYQGEFFIAAGVSGGYAHSIGKNLSMEYTLGIGYLQTHYRYYKACWGVDERWRAVRKNSSTFTWIGPTKAKVSLVWLINHKVRKGGIYE